MAANDAAEQGTVGKRMSKVAVTPFPPRAQVTQYPARIMGVITQRRLADGHAVQIHLQSCRVDIVIGLWGIDAMRGSLAQ